MWYKHRRQVTMLNEINISPKKQVWIVYIFLAVVTFAVFWQLSQYEFINFDDPVYVTENRHIQSGITLDGIRWAFSTTYAEFWHPLVWLSFMFDYQLYGLNAGGYHLTNLILHILSTLLLFWLFNRMTGAVWKSAFVAALFALHPLHVESVARISERKDVLSAFFWMLTLCLYVYYTEKPVIKRYLLVVSGFLLALLSKPMVITLPLIMILLDYWPLKRFESQKRNWVLWQLKEKIPFFVLSAVFSVITFYARYEQSLEYGSLSLSFRIENALIYFITYLRKMFWPNDLALCYPFSEQIPVWQVLGAALLIAIISVATIAAVRRLPYLFVGWLWYAIMILPVLGISQVGIHWLHDHYTYLPSIGISIMLVWGIPLLLPREDIRKVILFPAAIAVLTILTVLTWQQCGYWENSITLFRHDLQVTKDNYLSHSNLGLALAEKGEIKEAIDHYNEVIRLKPYYPYPYSNRGAAYAKLGQYQRAIEDFDEAIRLKPDYAEPYLNKGAAYGDLGQYKLAIENFTKAIRLKPDYTNAYFNRGITYFRHGNKEPGCYDAQKVCEQGDCRLLQSAKANAYCP
jgi:protein O-mannosyl-transferase